MIKRLIFDDDPFLRHLNVPVGRLACLVGGAGVGKSIVLSRFDSVVYLSALAKEAKDVPPRVRGQTRHLHFSTEALVAPVSLDDEGMGEDGHGLGGVLARWSKGRDTHLAEVTQRMQRFFPVVQSVGARKSTGRSMAIPLLHLRHHEAPFDLDHVGEGMAHLLGLLTYLVLCLPTTRPLLLLIDGPERHLHPSLHAPLAEFLSDLTGEHPLLQILCASHSPYFVDGLATKDVIVMAQGDDGLPRAALLSDHPDASRFTGLYRPGEFWCAVGDTWPAKGVLSPLAPEEAKPLADLWRLPCPVVLDPRTVDFLGEPEVEGPVCLGLAAQDDGRVEVRGVLGLRLGALREALDVGERRAEEPEQRVRRGDGGGHGGRGRRRWPRGGQRHGGRRGSRRPARRRRRRP